MPTQNHITRFTVDNSQFKREISHNIRLLQMQRDVTRQSIKDTRTLRSATNSYTNSLRKQNAQLKTQARQSTAISNANKEVARTFKLARLASYAYFAAFTARGATSTLTFLGETADVITRVTNQIKAAGVPGVGLNDAVAISTRTYADLLATGQLVGRIRLATRQYGYENREVLTVVQAINQSYRIAGSTTEEAKNSAIQLAQGLASGVVRGDELRSVMENNAALTAAIAKGMGITVGELRKIAEEGGTHTRAVFGAILKQAGSLNAQANQLEPTFAQAATILNTGLTLAIGKLTTILDKALGVREEFERLGRADIATFSDAVEPKRARISQLRAENALGDANAGFLNFGRLNNSKRDIEIARLQTEIDQIEARAAQEKQARTAFPLSPNLAGVFTQDVTETGLYKEVDKFNKALADATARSNRFLAEEDFRAAAFLAGLQGDANEFFGPDDATRRRLSNQFYATADIEATRLLGRLGRKSEASVDAILPPTAQQRDARLVAQSNRFLAEENFRVAGFLGGLKGQPQRTQFEEAAVNFAGSLNSTLTHAIATGNFDSVGDALKVSLTSSLVGSLLDVGFNAAFKAIGIPGFARGGRYGKGPIVVGEEGPELMFPDRPGTILPNEYYRQAAMPGYSRPGGGVTETNVNVYAYDRQELARAIREELYELEPKLSSGGSF